MIIMRLRAIIGGVDGINDRMLANSGPFNLIANAMQHDMAPDFEVWRLPRKKFLFLTLLLPMLLACVTNAGAASHYIRDGGLGSTTGTGDCATWEDAHACDQLPATLVRGDTYYIADGIYAGKTFNTTGTALITIKKATGSDHGTEIGWSNAYGDGTATFTSTLNFSTGYWLVDGISGGGPTNWTGPFGFKSTATTEMLLYGDGASEITVRHIELSGVGSYNDRQAGLKAYHCVNCTLSYWYMHDIGLIPFFSAADNLLVEYGYMKNWYDGASHSELCSCWAFGGGAIGTHTFRYNLFTDIRSTGGIMWDNSTNHAAALQVYGNVFYKDPAVPMNNAANGVIAGWTGGNGEDFYNVHVINNTFINIPGAQILSTFPIRSGSNEARNNLFYTISNPGGENDWQTISANHFISTSLIGTSPSTSSGSPFVDMNGRNFNLTGPTPAGVALPAPYDVDMYGRKRGADGVWDRGAVEFASGSGVTIPPAPTNLTVQ